MRLLQTLKPYVVNSLILCTFPFFRCLSKMGEVFERALPCASCQKLSPLSISTRAKAICVTAASNFSFDFTTYDFAHEN